jgi:hypothetical protein
LKFIFSLLKIQQFSPTNEMSQGSSQSDAGDGRPGHAVCRLPGHHQSMQDKPPKFLPFFPFLSKFNRIQYKKLRDKLIQIK